MLASGAAGSVEIRSAVSLRQWLRPNERLDDPAATALLDTLLLRRADQQRDRVTAVFGDGIDQFAIVRRRNDEPALESWWLPHDPHLPALSRLAEVIGGLLGRAAVRVADPHLQLVTYKPGQRAVFTVNGDDGQPLWLLKVLTPDRATVVTSRAKALTNLGVDAAVRAPLLVTDDVDLGAALFSFIPGSALKMLPAPRLTAALRDSVIAAAGRVHQHTAPTLPHWDVDGYVGRIGQALADASDVLGHSFSAMRAFDELTARLCANAASGRLIHADLTLRNIVVDDDASVGFIDWDDACIGPLERDLATLAAAFGGRAAIADVVSIYRTASDAPVDARMIGLYVDSQRLLKLCRRVVAGDRSPTTMTALHDVELQLLALG